MRNIILYIVLFLSSFTTVAETIDELESKVSKTNNLEEKADILNTLGIKYRDADMLDEAIDMHLQSLDIYEELHDDNGQAQSLYYIGGVYWRKNDYEQSLHYYTLALQIQEQLDELDDKARILNNMGLASRSLGDYETALEYYYRALACWLQEDEKAEVASTLNHIGNVFLNRNDADSALSYYNKALNLRRNLGDTISIASTLSNLAILYKNKSDFETAITYLNQSIELLIKVKEVSHLANSYNILGGVYWQKKAYKEALANYLKALEIREEQGDKKLIAATMNNIGLIYKDLGNYEKALEYYKRSYEQYQNMKDIFLESNALNFIGGVHWQAGNYELARDNYKRSLALRRIVGDKQYQARSHNNLALVYKSMGERDSALMEYQEALAMYKEIGDDKNAAALLNNIGNLYVKFGDNDGAAQYFSIALSMRKSIGDLSGEAYSSLDLGKVYISQNNNIIAAPLFNRAIWIAKELKNINLEKDVLLAFSELFENESDFNKAYRYYKAYSAIKDSIISTESIKKIADMQIRYETEKKEKELKVKDIQLLRQQEKNKRQQVLIYFGILLLGVISVFSVFISRKNRKIQQANEKLEHQNTEILQQKEEIQTQRDAIQTQKDEIEKQHDDLKKERKKTTESITYAFRIQKAMLTPEKNHEQILKKHFIIYKPKDIVSGDFYWMSKIGNLTYVAAVDCTGHGVPGAFMSMLGNTLFNEVVSKYSNESAASILNRLRENIKTALHQTFINKENENVVEDAMDCAFCIIDFDNLKLQFAGAHNPLYLLRKLDIKDAVNLNIEKYPKQIHTSDESATIYLFEDSIKAKRIEIDKKNDFEINSQIYAPPVGAYSYNKTLNAKTPYKEKFGGETKVKLSEKDQCYYHLEIEGDRMPLGVNALKAMDQPERQEKLESDFENHEVKLMKNDVIYLFSDGFCDQFGGKDGRKFLSKYFKVLLGELQQYPFAQHKQELEKHFELWKKEHNQIDDVLVMGIKIE